MLSLKRVTYDEPDFLLLAVALDEDLKTRYPFYQAQFSLLNSLHADSKVMLAYDAGKAIACGAVRLLPEEKHAAELKRMFVQPAYRGRGISRQLLQALETWATADGCRVMRLETGNNQPEAIALYLTSGYHITAPFGGYTAIEDAVCMKKNLLAAIL